MDLNRQEGEEPMTTTTELVTTRTAALDALSSNKLTFGEVLALLGGSQGEALPTAVSVPRVPQITQAHLDAMKLIPEIFGAVAPTERRALDGWELSKLLYERDRIEEILSILKPRKEESIREVIANHFDVIYEQSPQFDPATEKDARGHYLVKGTASAPGTGKEWKRTTSTRKPTISNEAIEGLWKDGTLTREEYLSLTKVPDVPRVFDEAKARDAIKKNPDLLFKLAGASTPGAQTTVITVGKDGG